MYVSITHFSPWCARNERTYNRRGPLCITPAPKSVDSVDDRRSVNASVGVGWHGWMEHGASSNTSEPQRSAPRKTDNVASSFISAGSIAQPVSLAGMLFNTNLTCTLTCDCAGGTRRLVALMRRTLARWPVTSGISVPQYVRRPFLKSQIHSALLNQSCPKMISHIASVT